MSAPLLGVGLVEGVLKVHVGTGTSVPHSFSSRVLADMPARRSASSASRRRLSLSKFVGLLAMSTSSFSGPLVVESGLDLVCNPSFNPLHKKLQPARASAGRASAYAARELAWCQIVVSLLCFRRAHVLGLLVAECLAMCLYFLNCLL